MKASKLYILHLPHFKRNKNKLNANTFMLNLLANCDFQMLYEGMPPSSKKTQMQWG